MLRSNGECWRGNDSLVDWQLACVQASKSQEEKTWMGETKGCARGRGCRRMHYPELSQLQTAWRMQPCPRQTPLLSASQRYSADTVQHTCTSGIVYVIKFWICRRLCTTVRFRAPYDYYQVARLWPSPTHTDACIISVACYLQTVSGLRFAPS